MHEATAESAIATEMTAIRSAKYGVRPPKFTAFWYARFDGGAPGRYGPPRTWPQKRHCAAEGFVTRPPHVRQSGAS